MMQRRWLGSRGPREISLSLHRVRSPVAVYSSHGSASYTCPRLIRGMIEQSSDVVYEERVKLFGNLLLVREFECTLKGNPRDCQFMINTSRDIVLPDTLQMHGTNLDNVSCLFALENAVSSSSGHARDVE
jgi:hypothetical protein